MAHELPTQQILESIDQAKALYEHLVLVVGLPRSGKTAALLAIERRAGYPYLSVSLQVSRRLLEVPVRHRPLEVVKIVDSIVEEIGREVVLLDNLEVLFDPSLLLDPLNLLRRLARNRVVVAAWTGAVDGGWLTYAAPGHPEHRRERVVDLLVVEAPYEHPSLDSV